MKDYYISTDAVEIISGTSSHLSPLYKEAAKAVEEDYDKSTKYLKNFIKSIEQANTKKKVDVKISSTKGNIRKFSGYDSIKTVLEFLKKELKNPLINDLATILQALESCQNEYSDGYSKKIKLVVIEYECAVDLLVTGITFIFASDLELKIEDSKIVVGKKTSTDYGVIAKIIKELAKQLKSNSHKAYLQKLTGNVGETHIEEGSIGDTLRGTGDILDIVSYIGRGIGKIGEGILGAYRTLKNTMFGIIPLIQCCLYLRYKRKADTVLELEEQAAYIQLNINQLKNIDSKKNEIFIKKQEAVVERLQKKSEKLRAELVETEKATSTELKKEQPNVNDGSSGDLEF